MNQIEILNQIDALKAQVAGLDADVDALIAKAGLPPDYAPIGDALTVLGEKITAVEAKAKGA